MQTKSLLTNDICDLDSIIVGKSTSTIYLYMEAHRDLRLVFIADPLVARAQRSALRHAQQENNEVRDDHALLNLRAMGVEPLSTSRHSARANERALLDTSLYMIATISA